MREILINKLTTMLNNNMGNKITEELAYGFLLSIDTTLKQLDEATPISSEDVQ